MSPKYVDVQPQNIEIIIIGMVSTEYSVFK